MECKFKVGDRVALRLDASPQDLDYARSRNDGEVQSLQRNLSDTAWCLLVIWASDRASHLYDEGQLELIRYERSELHDDSSYDS